MINTTLSNRCDGLCELCNTETASIAYTVSPKTDHPDNQVALCTVCKEALDNGTDSNYWRITEGSIWNEHAPVQALSYRILHQHQQEEWANDILQSVDLGEEVKEWALSAFQKAAVHVDAFGNELTTGDTVVLTQNLDVKGTSFSAPKGTVVKRIRLVADNLEQIEGKINEQVIVILTKYVKKSS